MKLFFRILGSSINVFWWFIASVGAIWGHAPGFPKIIKIIDSHVNISFFICSILSFWHFEKKMILTIQIMGAFLYASTLYDGYLYHERRLDFSYTPAYLIFFLITSIIWLGVLNWNHVQKFAIPLAPLLRPLDPILLYFKNLFK